MTVEYCGFQWDDEENRLNKAKHKVSFETAVHVFEDPFLVEDFDEEHSSEEEERWEYIGMVREVMVLFVIASDRDDTRRIISARKATAKEVRKYNEQNARNL